MLLPNTMSLYPATSKAVGHLSKSAEVMKLVNKLIKAPEMAVTMQEFSKEMTKVYHYFSFLFFLNNVFTFHFHNLTIDNLPVCTYQFSSLIISAMC
jgi:hypothetical protein